MGITESVAKFLVKIGKTPVEDFANQLKVGSGNRDFNSDNKVSIFEEKILGPLYDAAYPTWVESREEQGLVPDEAKSLKESSAKFLVKMGKTPAENFINQLKVGSGNRDFNDDDKVSAFEEKILGPLYDAAYPTWVESREEQGLVPDEAKSLKESSAKFLVKMGKTPAENFINQLKVGSGNRDFNDDDKVSAFEEKILGPLYDAAYPTYVALREESENTPADEPIETSEILEESVVEESEIPQKQIIKEFKPEDSVAEGHKRPQKLMIQ